MSVVKAAARCCCGSAHSVSEDERRGGSSSLQRSSKTGPLPYRSKVGLEQNGAPQAAHCYEIECPTGAVPRPMTVGATPAADNTCVWELCVPGVSHVRTRANLPPSMSSRGLGVAADDMMLGRVTRPASPNAGLRAWSDAGPCAFDGPPESPRDIRELGVPGAWPGCGIEPVVASDIRTSPGNRPASRSVNRECVRRCDDPPTL